MDWCLHSSFYYKPQSHSRAALLFCASAPCLTFTLRWISILPKDTDLVYFLIHSYHSFWVFIFIAYRSMTNCSLWGNGMTSNRNPSERSFQYSEGQTNQTNPAVWRFLCRYQWFLISCSTSSVKLSFAHFMIPLGQLPHSRSYTVSSLLSEQRELSGERQRQDGPI